MVDRKMNEQNCDNKTQTNNELEWHGDKDEGERCRSDLHMRPSHMDHQQQPHCAYSTCGPFNIPFNSLSFINVHPWLSFRNLITPLSFQRFGFHTTPSSEQPPTNIFTHSLEQLTGKPALPCTREFWRMSAYRHFSDSDRTIYLTRHKPVSQHKVKLFVC